MEVTPNEEKLEEELVEKENPKKSFQKKLHKVEEERDKAIADMEHWKNEFYRAYADTKNLRSQLEKDHMQAMKYRAEGFIDELLPVLDSFYAVLKNEPSDPNLKNYLIGFQYIYKNMVSALENEGVKEITPNIGDKFSPETMNAVETKEDEGEENRVLEVQFKGYKLHDRLIRPASVVVSVKQKEEKETKIDA
ncbi:MAG: nucleotide exchange factor GrpE [Bacilli bacterium]|nr:nucleotide exchange factor GrpE [Bacilli bacterium]